jgi:hypothetical protein
VSLTAWIMWIISVCLMFGALIWFATRLDSREARRRDDRRSAFQEAHAEDIANLKGTWRVGRHLGRTLYLQVGEEPSDADVLLGMMDTEDGARTVIDAVNEKQRREGPWTS